MKDNFERRASKSIQNPKVQNHLDQIEADSKSSQMDPQGHVTYNSPNESDAVSTTRDIKELKVDAQGIQSFISEQITIKAWSVPKQGNTDNQNEDCFHIPLHLEDITDSIRLTISDGASSTWESRLWAQLLTAFTNKPCSSIPFVWQTPEDWELGLDSLRLEWKSGIPPVTQQLEYLREIAEMKQKQGAGACLLVLELNPHTYNWQATGVGNCLFAQVRQNTIVTSFPLVASDFDLSTPLLMSVKGNLPLPDQIWYETGRYNLEDEFFLLTDELGKWLLSDMIGNRLDQLRTVDSPDDFIARLRTLRDVQDDDMTCVYIKT